MLHNIFIGLLHLLLCDVEGTLGEDEVTVCITVVTGSCMQDPSRLNVIFLGFLMEILALADTTTFFLPVVAGVFLEYDGILLYLK